MDNLTSLHIFEGDFTVAEDMVKNGKLIKEKIPRVINGDFICSKLSLTTLEGSPEKVNRSFNCSVNNLTSLEFGPEKVNGDFYCYANSITSLEFGPKKVNGGFYCSYNKLTSLEFGPKKVNGGLWCTNNVNNLEIEKDFIEVSMFKNEYYTDLLNYMLSNEIDLERVESWPEGFISKNLKRSIKGKNKFNL